MLTIKDFVNALCYIEKQYDQPDAPIKSAVILRTLLKYEPCLKGDIIISGNNKPLLDESCNAVNIILKRFWQGKYPWGIIKNRKLNSKFVKCSKGGVPKQNALYFYDCKEMWVNFNRVVELYQKIW